MKIELFFNTRPDQKGLYLWINYRYRYSQEVWKNLLGKFLTAGHLVYLRPCPAVRQLSLPGNCHNKNKRQKDYQRLKFLTFFKTIFIKFLCLFLFFWNSTMFQHVPACSGTLLDVLACSSMFQHVLVFQVLAQAITTLPS